MQFYLALYVDFLIIQQSGRVGNIVASILQNQETEAFRVKSPSREVANSYSPI